MTNLSIEEIRKYEYRPKAANYTGPTNYKVNGKDYEIAPWNHPASLANHILNFIQHTIFYGIYIVGPMGHGKTKIAETIAHFVHLKNPNFKIVWAGEHEFTHQENFFQSLPKVPHFIIFDDISGALKQLSEKQMEANFSSLTRVRWILDPASGQIPVIVCAVGHYSKNLEKEFRAQLGMSIYAAFGNEEMTNLNTIAEKDTDAYKTLKQFGNMYNEMFARHKFSLYLPNGKRIPFETDKPFRPFAAISKTNGKIILHTKFDVCGICAKKRHQKTVPAKEVLDIVINAYGNQGLKALQFAELKRGFSGAVQSDLAAASDYIEQKIIPVFNYDHNSMIEEIRALKHWKQNKTVYHKRKKEFEGIDKLDKIGIFENKENENINTSQNTGYE